MQHVRYPWYRLVLYLNLTVVVLPRFFMDITTIPYNVDFSSSSSWVSCRVDAPACRHGHGAPEVWELRWKEKRSWQSPVLW